MSIVMVVGSPGAGKTAITNAAAKRGVRIIQIGTLMEEEATRKGYIKDRDQIRHSLGLRLQRELQAHAFGSLSKMKGNVVVDTHMSIWSNDRYIVGVPHDSLESLKNVVAWVYIDAATGDITKRRRLDKSRNRDMVSPHDIEMQRMLNLSLFFHCAWYTGAPLYIIYNKEGKLKESIRQFDRILSETIGV